MLDQIRLRFTLISGVVEHLQKEAAFLLQKSFVWDGELMVAPIGGNIAEHQDKIRQKAISDFKAMQQTTSRSWLKKLMGDTPQF
ncbi:MAG: hypothetical protein KGS72_02905 [Cyanobacteria bacterium REEB67]|nr:hypothetical protein [Cyanobacteria bacterium REEB67]